MDTAHIQGMLNVAFTRARDEIHVFHSAPIDTFTMAGDRPGAIGAWLEHCAKVQSEGAYRGAVRAGKVDSQFEADVADALRARGVEVCHQYPACGFFIDLMCELDEVRLGVECDGELYHLDEHGQLRVEDLERQAIIERAGWSVLRIPYRSWRSGPADEVERVLARMRELALDDEGLEDGDHGEGPGAARTLAAPPSAKKSVAKVSAEGAAIMGALSDGDRDEEDVFRSARITMGYGRLGPKIRQSFQRAARQLVTDGFISVEEGEYFLTAEGRTAEVRAGARTYRPGQSNNYRRRRSYYSSSYNRRPARRRYRRY
jgi:very-short-patch-repair endonuclease